LGVLATVDAARLDLRAAVGATRGEVMRRSEERVMMGRTDAPREPGEDAGYQSSIVGVNRGRREEKRK
jgi:hypothetical protein